MGGRGPARNSVQNDPENDETLIWIAFANLRDWRRAHEGVSSVLSKVWGESF